MVFVQNAIAVIPARSLDKNIYVYQVLLHSFSYVFAICSCNSQYQQSSIAWSDYARLSYFDTFN